MNIKARSTHVFLKSQMNIKVRGVQIILKLKMNMKAKGFMSSWFQVWTRNQESKASWEESAPLNYSYSHPLFLKGPAGQITALNITSSTTETQRLITRSTQSVSTTPHSSIKRLVLVLAWCIRALI